MSLDVLKSRSQINHARTELDRRRLSFSKPWWQSLMQQLGLAKRITVGDSVKSWDVLKTLQYIEARVPKESPILDVGAYASEVLCALHRLGYSNLVGVDLNPDLHLMPYANAIRYEVSDFMHTPFEAESFQAITAISVIEHGFDGHALLSEVSRILRPGGYFIVSFDYWPQKVNTSGVLFFGMDWRIFSEEEVRELLDEARKHELIPTGEIALQAEEKAISCAERDYTFAWLTLRKGV